LAEVDDRIREVLKLQLAGKWRAGKSHIDFAQRYGVAIKTVQDWATQASRFQRMCLGDDDEVRMQILANVARAGRIALKQSRTYETRNGDTRTYDCPDVRSYLAAQELSAKLLRLFDNPERDEGADEQVPVEQLAAALRALGHEVKLNERPRSEPAPISAAGETDREEREEGGAGED